MMQLVHVDLQLLHTACGNGTASFRITDHQHWSTTGLRAFTIALLSENSSVKLIKFADDTTLIGLVGNRVSTQRAN